MIKLLKEEYFKRSDNPDLVNLIIQDEQIISFHFVYFETEIGPNFVFTRGSSDLLEKAKVSFKTRLKQIEQPDIENICFLIVQFYLEPDPKDFSLKIPNPQIQGKNLPIEIQKIIEPTKGYLLYQEQLSAIYQLATCKDDQTTEHWVKGFNMKRVNVHDSIKELRTSGKPLTYFYDLFIPNKEGYFVLRKPVKEAQNLLNFLQAK